jgi:MSHA pilin protein MshD
MSVMPVSAPDKKRGFTLIELIITIVIMGFAAMIITPYLTAITHGPDPVLREKALGLAQAMMDEVLTKRWDDNTANGGGPIITSETLVGSRGTSAATPAAATPAALGPDTGETRAAFDDVDDYHGLAEPDGSGLFHDQNGTTLAGTWAGFSRQVTVHYIASATATINATQPLSSGLSTDSKRIVVTVTSPLGETFELVAVTCNF